VRQEVQAKQLTVEHIGRSLNTADFFTHLLDPEEFHRRLPEIGLYRMEEIEENLFFNPT